MPLSPPVSRQLRHQRAVRAVAYEREDGLWDIEACLTDHKPRDVALAGGLRPNGLPIHELWLRITIDRKLTVVDAEASSDWAPYAGLCQAANSSYRALVGLNLLQNFRREASRLLGGTVGCTHLTELCGVLPTVAIQAFAGEVWDSRTGSPGDEPESQAGNPADGRASVGEAPPFQLGRCHALRFDGEAVRQFYPRWYAHAPRPAGRGADEAGVRTDHGPRSGGETGVLSRMNRNSGNEVQSTSQTEGITHEDSRVPG
ncbi:hypothetical protein CY652_19225 [Burkholderia sp. WAC0059]|uniref:DUF2889 domain-containing protein n=1 Tax=Burkholderia sp. WAC0059 TaxID=2066022 RepID=UPI000C7EE0A6|nr:DUF2889 domain-containing protein [Burkholderia sp. WAC0059]PLZ00791.1 hypothetical protein CY652_19225 [Burkholderia sp. WAC0059]